MSDLQKYEDVAKKYGLTATELALAWCKSRYEQERIKQLKSVNNTVLRCAWRRTWYLGEPAAHACRWFVASTIIGATNMAQLKENLNAFDKKLSEECISEIQAIYKQHRDPTLS
jgi:aryl-alcohol dehydrogenase-like predicted oxidoreductase